MRSETIKDLRLFILVFSISVVVLGFVNYANGQQTEQPISGTPTTTTTTTSVDQQQQQPQQEPQGVTIDPAQATALGIGALTGAGALVKSVIDKKDSKTRDRATDKDAGEFFVLISKWIQCKKLYPHMTDSEILDLPISNNPYSAQTLGQAITERADKWVEGNQIFWKIPTPKMSVPTSTTVAAIEAAKGNQTAETKPVVPASKPVQQQPQQAASSTNNTSATVGK